MKIEIGDILNMKEPHPCGCNRWQVLRVGADFRLKCLGCDHQVMLKRTVVEKNTKTIEHSTSRQ